VSDFDIIHFVFSIVSLLIAIIGHEIMHGYAALKCGDKTALWAGRLSLNPIKHIDMVGSIILPVLLAVTGAPFLFGWAKPVPVDMQTVLQNKGLDGAIGVSLAGVTYNIALAAFASMALMFTPNDNITGIAIGAFLTYLITINVILAVFNLWPIPPLDGANALGFSALKFGATNFGYKILNIDGRIGMIFILIAVATPASEILFAPAKWLLSILL
jgi:Zn-dependent protease